MAQARALVTGPLAGWTGRLLLLGAVGFWWGAVVAPNLVSLVFPEWLAPEAIPRDLNPDIDYEGRLANRVSTAALLVLGAFALLIAVVSRRRDEGRTVVGGWALLAGTAFLLSWEETSEVHSTLVPAIGSRLVNVDLVSRAGPYVWVLLLSPMIAGFVVLMGVLLSPRAANSQRSRAICAGVGGLALCSAMRGRRPRSVPRPGK